MSISLIDFFEWFLGKKWFRKGHLRWILNRRQTLYYVVQPENDQVPTGKSLIEPRQQPTASTRYTADLPPSPSPSAGRTSPCRTPVPWPWPPATAARGRSSRRLCLHRVAVDWDEGRAVPGSPPAPAVRTRWPPSYPSGRPSRPVSRSRCWAAARGGSWWCWGFGSRCRTCRSQRCCPRRCCTGEGRCGTAWWCFALWCAWWWPRYHTCSSRTRCTRRWGLGPRCRRRSRGRWSWEADAEGKRMGKSWGLYVENLILANTRTRKEKKFAWLWHHWWSRHVVVWKLSS